MKKKIRDLWKANVPQVIWKNDNFRVVVKFNFEEEEPVRTVIFERRKLFLDALGNENWEEVFTDVVFQQLVANLLGAPTIDEFLRGVKK